MSDSNLVWFGSVLSIGSIIFVLSLLGKRTGSQVSQSALQTTQSSIPSTDSDQVRSLQQQCVQLRQELQQQQTQLLTDWQNSTFEQLQSLLISYPTARKMAETKPDLPAKNLIALFTPLENLLEAWQIEPIGAPWEAVPYDPQLHQPDTDDLAAGEPVYVRFVGYRQGNRILCPAKVSRTLPGQV
ncbi:molecular chaperone GrpE [Oscillatoria sp. FACHB-1407]|uniref:nucleotide exchange factor GrpE n=1 Tax=Oscillatoria sp. FACHB-1407 TaxID=2692847 RepID=UPI0016833587|nr:molecular chaperone GrpE [Oscillatoria sp. FACHB-1407]MBD2460556.1 molecular chaperone GrpE [Oscillatoria sp. FACHB-1407]